MESVIGVIVGLACSLCCGLVGVLLVAGILWLVLRKPTPAGATPGPQAKVSEDVGIPVSSIKITMDEPQRFGVAKGPVSVPALPVKKPPTPAAVEFDEGETTDIDPIDPKALPGIATQQPTVQGAPRATSASSASGSPLPIPISPSLLDAPSHPGLEPPPRPPSRVQISLPGVGPEDSFTSEVSAPRIQPSGVARLELSGPHPSREVPAPLPVPAPTTPTKAATPVVASYTETRAFTPPTFGAKNDPPASTPSSAPTVHAPGPKVKTPPSAKRPPPTQASTRAGMTMVPDEEDKVAPEHDLASEDVPTRGVHDHLEEWDAHDPTMIVPRKKKPDEK